VNLAEAAAQADELAENGSAQELATLRSEWDDELEAAARSADFRERALAFRAVGMFRWRAKEELLRRGLDDGSPAARGSALLSLELLSRDHPSTVNSVRPLLHKMLEKPKDRRRPRAEAGCRNPMGRSMSNVLRSSTYRHYPRCRRTSFNVLQRFSDVESQFPILTNVRHCCRCAAAYLTYDCHFLFLLALLCTFASSGMRMASVLLTRFFVRVKAELFSLVQFSFLFVGVLCGVLFVA